MKAVMESKSFKKGEKLANEDPRPDLAWVETVLGEMKSVFNKQLTISDFKTEYGSKSQRNNVLTRKLDTRKAESAKSAKSERKKSSPSNKSGASKSPTGKSVHSKFATSKTSNTKQVSKQVSTVKQNSAKQATTKSASSSPVVERVTKNISTRKSSLLASTDGTTKGNTKKQGRTSASPSASTTKRGALSADKKNAMECDVNRVGSRLSAARENVGKAIRDKLTATPVFVPVPNTRGKIPVQSSSIVTPDNTRTKSGAVNTVIHGNRKTVTTCSSKTASTSTSTSYPLSVSTLTQTATSCSAATASSARTTNVAVAGTSNFATTSCIKTPVVICTASPTIHTVIGTNALRASTATDTRVGTTAILLVGSATIPSVVSASSNIATTSNTAVTSFNGAGSSAASDTFIKSRTTQTATTTTVAAANSIVNATKLATKAPATTVAATSTSSRSSTKLTVSAVNTITNTSNSFSTVTSNRRFSRIDDNALSAAIDDLCRSCMKEDKVNKHLRYFESKFVKAVAGRMKTKTKTRKDGSHAGNKQQPRTAKICNNSKSVTDVPMSCTSYPTVKSTDSMNPKMTLSKNQGKVATCASSFPCASECPKMVTPVFEVPSNCPKPEGPVLESPNNESRTSVQNQADSLAPLSANMSSQGSAKPYYNINIDDPLEFDEDYDDYSEKSEDTSILNRSEKVASDAEDNAPRLLITLKPGKVGGESITSWKGCREVIGSEGVWSVANVETVDDNLETIRVKDKRSLRSQAPQKPVPEPEPVGVKRSARRRSKDYHRETVLQCAIARKEKSFSSLVQYDERAAAAKNSRAAANRNSRQNMKNSASKRAAAEAKKLAKGAKAAQKKQLKNLLNVNKARKSDIQTRTATRGRHTSYRITSPVYNEIPMDVCYQKPTSGSMNSNAQTYTKTGKRRYKPYKGLRYSLNSNSGKRNKLTRHQRTLSDADRVNNEIIGRPMIARKTDKSQTLKDLEAESYTLAAENYSLLRSGPPSAPRSQNNTRVAELNVYESDYESENSSIIDVGSPEFKTEFVSDDGDDDNEDEDEYADFKRKRFCYDKSPESGRKKLHKKHKPGDMSDDDMSQPIPEVATSSSKGKAGGILCYCQKSTSLFAASPTPGAPVMYCQAMDALDEHLIGCAEVVKVTNVCLRRAGVRCPFVLLCEVHKQRLLRHMCCPGCGIFCTQGKFVMCSSKHLYHRECQVTKEGVLSCPHCGEVSPPVDCTLTLSTLRTPVYLPELKPPTREPTARMTIKESRRDNIVQEREKGMTLPLDKEKLTQLVNTACSMQVVCDQEICTSSTMEETLFIAANTGNAEKILQALASGIDANHTYEEANMGSALHIAASKGNLAAVHILLQSGAQIDSMDGDQNTALILAAQAGHNAIVEYLIKAGASVTLKGGDGMTALHVAAKTGNLEACQYLLSVPNTKNSFVDTVDDGGWTSLVYATENCHTNVARFLLKKRADPHIRDAEQNIALHWSAFSGCMDVSEMLINYGSEVNCVNVHGDTPLHVGARRDKYDCVLMLLSRGARVDVVNTVGDSPLDCCVKRSNECYTAIKLNILLGNVVLNVREPSQKILCNDISRGREVNPIQCVNSEDDEEEPTDYTYVSKNCVTSNISIDNAITSVQSCHCTDNCSNNRCSCTLMSEQCWYDDEGKLVPEFNYADAPMIFECNQCCSCNQITCNNRVVQHGFTGRFQLFRTQRRGWGVRTLTAVAKGSFVCEYIGEIITDCEADNRDDDTYLFDLDNRRRQFGRNKVHEHKNSVELVSRSLNSQEHLDKTTHDGETYCIDARYYGNVSRFINHMCEPNLLAVRVFVDHQDVHFPRMAFFANRDIEPNEELGFDYGEKFWAVKCKSFTCSCGAESCKYSEFTFKKTLNLSGASEQ